MNYFNQGRIGQQQGGGGMNFNDDQPSTQVTIPKDVSILNLEFLLLKLFYVDHLHVL